MHYASGSMDVLQLDLSGRPQAWISSREAAVLYASDSVAWTLGDTFHVLRGGMQRRTGLQSRIEVAPDRRGARRRAEPSVALDPGPQQPEALRAGPPGLRVLRQTTSTSTT